MKIWASGGKCLRMEVSCDFTLLGRCPEGRSPRVSLDMRMGESQSLFGRGREKNDPAPTGNQQPILQASSP
jgi:hypothetical protein